MTKKGKGKDSLIISFMANSIVWPESVEAQRVGESIWLICSCKDDGKYVWISKYKYTYVPYPLPLPLSYQSSFYFIQSTHLQHVHFQLSYIDVMANFLFLNLTDATR